MNNIKHNKLFQILVVTSSMLLLTACGGGGGSRGVVAPTTVGGLNLEDASAKQREAADTAFGGTQLAQEEASTDPTVMATQWIGDAERSWSVGSAFVRGQDDSTREPELCDTAEEQATYGCRWDTYFYADPVEADIVAFSDDQFSDFCTSFDDGGTISVGGSTFEFNGCVQTPNAVSYNTKVTDGTGTVTNLPIRIEYSSTRVAITSDTIGVTYTLESDGMVSVSATVNGESIDLGESAELLASLGQGLFTAPTAGETVAGRTAERQLRIWLISQNDDQSRALFLEDTLADHLRDGYDTNPMEDGTQTVSVTKIGTDDDRSTFRAGGSLTTTAPGATGYLFEARYSGFGAWDYNPDNPELFSDASQYFFYGLATPADVVNSFTASGATYEGFAYGNYKGIELIGNVELEADFSQARGTGSAVSGSATFDSITDAAESTIGIALNARINGASISGAARVETQATGTLATAFAATELAGGGCPDVTVPKAGCGALQGLFAGPNAEELIGTFEVQNALTGDDTAFFKAGFISTHED